MVDCSKIKSIIPGYIQHTVSMDDIRSVEEHLCICQSCREYLGSFLEKQDIARADKSVTQRKDFSLKEGMLTYVVVGLGLVAVIFSFLLLFRNH